MSKVTLTEAKLSHPAESEMCCPEGAAAGATQQWEGAPASRGSQPGSPRPRAEQLEMGPQEEPERTPWAELEELKLKIWVQNRNICYLTGSLTTTCFLFPQY